MGVSKRLRLHVAAMLIITSAGPRQAALPAAPGAPRLPRRRQANAALFDATSSCCSQTRQSARRLIGSELWESVAICSPAPTSSL